MTGPTGGDAAWNKAANPQKSVPHWNHESFNGLISSPHWANRQPPLTLQSAPPLHHQHQKPPQPPPPPRADETVHLPASVAVVVGHQCYGDSMVPGAGWVLPTNQIPCWCLEQTGSCHSAITTTPAPAPHLVSNSNLEINLGSSQLPVETSEAETQ